ncbi:MAG: electron transport complex subunit RsxC [Steroidobacteraceae bacterium]|nr:electron transport complex subunit RsxC [Steroidobacteraceae bacterium]
MRMSIRGGLRLDSHKARPLQRPIRVVPPPTLLALALDQGSGEDAHPRVLPGTRVQLGQLVASAHGAAAALHSPVSGVVREIALRPAARGTGLCIVIENDGRDERAASLAPADWLSLDGAELLALIAAGGAAGLGGAAFPTATKLALGRATGAELLLLNGAECEPWICCDDALMRERAADVVLGAQVMIAAAGCQRCIIAIEDDKPAAIAAIESAVNHAGDARIAVLALPAVFPLGAEGPLVAAVTGREVPHDGLPPQAGVVVQNVATAAAVARLARDGLPLVSRIVTVTGGGVREPANVEARLGTPVADLVAACGGYGAADVRHIAGGSLTGRELPGATVPLTKGLNCVLVATAADLPARAPEQPCIRCGDCATACPVGLLPQQLHLATRSNDATGLARYGLSACIECGCCDYVCPSAIPLTARFQAARERQHLQDAARQRALDARARFERHQRRLAERAAAERRAFDDARRRARGPEPGAD